jgi:hypothetical protein
MRHVSADRFLWQTFNGLYNKATTTRRAGGLILSPFKEAKNQKTRQCQ